MDNLNKNDIDKIIEEDILKRIIHPRNVGMADNDLKIRLKCYKEIDEADRILFLPK